MYRSNSLPLYQAKNASIDVAVEHDQAGDQHDLRHVVEMAHRDDVLQAVELRIGMGSVSTIAKPE